MILDAGDNAPKLLVAIQELIAQGIVTAARQVDLTVPLVVRLEGTNVELGKQILADSGLPIISGSNMADAAAKVVKATGATVTIPPELGKAKPATPAKARPAAKKKAAAKKAPAPKRKAKPAAKAKPPAKKAKTKAKARPAKKSGKGASKKKSNQRVKSKPAKKRTATKRTAKKAARKAGKGKRK